MGVWLGRIGEDCETGLGWVLGIGRVRLFEEEFWRRVLERHAERTGNGNDDTWHVCVRMVSDPPFWGFVIIRARGPTS